MPDFLTDFPETYPGIELEVISELSSTLLARQARGELDLVIAIHKEFNMEPMAEGWHEKLVWVTDKKHRKTQYEKIPLVVAPQGCVYRHRMLHTIEHEAIPWCIAYYTGTSYGGICAAVIAGLGVTVLAANTVPNELQTHDYTTRLPRLPDANVKLHYSRADAEPAVLRLAQYIIKVSRYKGRLLNFD